MSKTFKDKLDQQASNPTLQFISKPEERPTPQEAQAPDIKQPERCVYQARRAMPQYGEETKSRRVQIMLTPSLYEAARAKAAEARMSVNEYITTAIIDAIERS